MNKKGNERMMRKIGWTGKIEEERSKTECVKKKRR